MSDFLFASVPLWLPLALITVMLYLCVESKAPTSAEDKDVVLTPSTDKAPSTNNSDELTALEKELGITDRKGWKPQGKIYVRDYTVPAPVIEPVDPPPKPPVNRYETIIERVEVVRPCGDCTERRRLAEIERLDTAVVKMSYSSGGLDLIGFESQIKTWATVNPLTADRLIHAYAIVQSTGNRTYFNRVLANLTVEAPKIVERARFMSRLGDRFEEVLSDEVGRRLKAIQEGHSFLGFWIQNGMPGIVIHPEQLGEAPSHVVQLGQPASRPSVFHPFPTHRIQQTYGQPTHWQPTYDQLTYVQPSYVHPNSGQAVPFHDADWWRARAAQIKAGGNINSDPAYNPHAAPVYNNPHAAPVYNNPHAAPVYNNPHAAPVGYNSTLPSMFAFPPYNPLAPPVNTTLPASMPQPGYNPNPPPGYDVFGNKMIPLTVYLPQPGSDYAGTGQPAVQLPASADQPGLDIFGQPLPNATPEPAKKPTKPWLTKTKLKDSEEFNPPGLQFLINLLDPPKDRAPKVSTGVSYKDKHMNSMRAAGLLTPMS